MYVGMCLPEFIKYKNIGMSLLQQIPEIVSQDYVNVPNAALSSSQKPSSTMTSLVLRFVVQLYTACSTTMRRRSSAVRCGSVRIGASLSRAID